MRSLNQRRAFTYLRNNGFPCLWVTILALITGCVADPPDRVAPQGPSRPNILLIVLDDLGYSDLGAYGSEINTPNIDRLAHEDMLFTNFHAAPSCSPSRAMLLTGNEAHQAGLGTMYEKRQPYQMGKPGYEGYLSDRVVTVASLLGDAGYVTYMAGKWHLGQAVGQGPSDRGFQRSFALLEGGGGHFDDSGYRKKLTATYHEDGEIAELPSDFYSSDFYTQKLIQYIGEGTGDRPFFGYLAYTAPHWPLQAPPEDIAEYEGKYDDGFDALYQRRLKKMKALGLVAKDQPESLYLPGNKGWTDFNAEEKLRRAKEMAVYAAMIDRVDQNIGRLLTFLENQGRRDNTLILLLSDNAAMGNSLHRPPYLDTLERADNSLANMGLRGSYLYQHYGWARVSNAPFKGIKMHVVEGGLRVPAIAWSPADIRSNQRSDELVSVMDIAPTLLEAAGVGHPGESYRGREILPPEGRSIWPLLTGREKYVRNPSDTLAWETWGERATMNREWKALLSPAPFGNGRWQLFNLTTDPGETRDLGAEHPGLLNSMISDWKQYATKVGVVLPQPENETETEK